jgi:hypothetical protein
MMMFSPFKNRKPDRVALSAELCFIENGTWLLAYALDLNKQAVCNSNRVAKLLDRAASRTTNLTNVSVWGGRIEFKDAIRKLAQNQGNRGRIKQSNNPRAKYSTRSHRRTKYFGCDRES